MPKHLLLVTHWTQAHRADCVSACVKIVLDYIGKPINYDRLLRLLQVMPEVGTPARNVLNLTQLGLDVFYQRGTLDEVRRHLFDNKPCITFVDTGELPYWDESTAHAVVVIGIDDDSIYVNDPAFESAPQIISHGDFLLAWLGADEYYAVIQKRK